MNDYNELIKKISHEYNIQKGDKENQKSYISRVVYSIVGLMGYAALWDDIEIGKDYSSIINVKNRMKDVLESFIDMYKDINIELISTEVVENIYRIYNNAGIFYHCKNNVSAADYHEASFSGIKVVRGQNFSDQVYISGVGAYKKDDINISDPSEMCSMFLIPDDDLLQEWRSVKMKVNWELADTGTRYEYLRTREEFSAGYWIMQPIDNVISLARSGEKANYTYYLYYKTNVTMQICQLPQWMCTDGKYRTLASGDLLEQKSLPISNYFVDGPIVYLKMGYLFPPRELNLLTLYSWPTDDDFTKIISVEIFETLKSIFEHRGLILERGNND